MADEDDSQKTEEPTPKKLQEALDKGQVPTSQEFKTWAMLLVATILLASSGSYIAESIAVPLGGFLANIHDMSVEDTSIENPMQILVWQIFIVMMIPFAAFVVGGILGNRIQHPAVFTFEKMKPKMNKISPLGGLKRLFSTRTLVEGAKIIAKLITVLAVLFAIVWPQRDMLDTMMMVPLTDVLEIILTIAIQLFGGVLAVMTVIAAIDFSYQKFQHHKQLRMSKQEIKDEYKQTDGDPMVKARLRQIRSERSRQRMMAAVPEADVVITNPTHYAIAVQYKHLEMEVPKVVAKGVDTVALKIREVAEEHKITIVENPPLARALYATVEVDDEIPPDHYKAVAEVIGYVMKLKRAGLR
ncbi:flagellar biosynthesis protein FlhB [Kordiimonas sediminis]|uniref:Flagellar biosynthetic protein FlhB n=1 Tax=Kordiimonas sediminis TaxID=1735581 RepID=A0A919AWS3_9PROT|nr:flagellar biosynthesis protein FlhB [Kordiimonas sediminis]GHF27094.1 flagellar biosynthesis protein FlhB [Kordiimonas sediminis]